MNIRANSEFRPGNAAAVLEGITKRALAAITEGTAVVKDADGKPSYGTVDGFDTETNELFFTKVSNSVKLKEGEIVSTSGLGGRYPAGLVIGTIESIETDEYGVSQVARIKPEADFNEFSQMFVINRTLDEPFLTGPEEGGAAGE